MGDNNLKWMEPSKIYQNWRGEVSNRLVGKNKETKETGKTIFHISKNILPSKSFVFGSYSRKTGKTEVLVDCFFSDWSVVCGLL